MYLAEIVLFLVVSFAFQFKAIANHDIILILVILLSFAAQVRYFT